MGHKKEDCVKYKKWLEKNGNLALTCLESNFTKVPSNTWWIDSDSTIHIANNVSGFLNLWKLVGSEQGIYLGNRMCSHAEAVGTYRLVLNFDFHLDLKNTF